ncbi:uncharacterized protein ACNLHF_001764 isoform 1-T2 [Anomaloglossus baeobatrachus]|uniref:uncharacterized protein LOC142256391 n=1 Tax=Anomaloglossus baeobatrachus TaxID=238106 RepID=UPI003F4FD01E
MKITDFFPSSKPFSNKEKESPVCTPSSSNAEQQEENMSVPGVSGTITIQTPRKKRERFTDAENQKLVDTILVHVERLFGPKPVNALGRAAIWDTVVNEVNKIGDLRRTVPECKKRWHDYKRKIKQAIENLKKQPSTNGQMIPLSEIFTRRQLKVAEFFKLDAIDVPKNEMQDESSSDIGECASTNDFLLPTSYIIESDDDLMPSQNHPVLPMTSLPSTSHQEKVISQSHEEPQAVREPADAPKPKAVNKSTPVPSKAAETQLLLEAQMDQLSAQQDDVMEALKSVQKSLAESLTTQNKMYSLVKGSFLELQKTLLSGQKASRDRSGMLELSLNSLHAKLDEINSALRVKQLQDIMSSDESEPSASGSQETGSAPTTGYMPAATYTSLTTYTSPTTYTPTNAKPRKRPSDKNQSLTGSMKKIKKSK